MNLFLDLDGVSADFNEWHFRRFGRDAFRNHEDDVDWKVIKEAGNIYADMKPLPDFPILWEYSKKFNPIIITGIPNSIPEHANYKRSWIDRHMGEHVPMIACLSKEKSKFATRGSVIIDDWPKYRKFWEDKGGIWIHHENAKSSVEQLQEIVRRGKSWSYQKPSF